MSLIESALQKAKQVAGDAQQTLQGPVRPAHEPGPAASPARFADTVTHTRVIPTAAVDRGAMERAGVLLGVDDVAAENAYRILRTRVQQRMLAQGWQSLGVTAAGAAEGKTLTAINLAISLARDVSTRVFLVDLDLLRPKIATYLGLQFDKGLSDYVAGRATFDEILYNPGVDRLTVVPNAQPLRHSSELLGSPRIHDLCAALTAEVPRHLIVFDLPPVLATDDVMKFRPNLDCTLFVVSEGVTARDVLLKAKEVLDEMNLLGVVLNRSSETGENLYY